MSPTSTSWDSSVIAEDRAVLEAGDPDATLDVSARRSTHASDRPGLIMRRRLLELLRAHGEHEVTNATAAGGVRIMPPLVPEVVS
jgi:hypothetical protein